MLGFVKWRAMRVIIYSQVRILGEALASCLAEHEGMAEVRYRRRIESVASCALEHGSEVILFDVSGSAAFDEARALRQKCPAPRLVALAIPETTAMVIACADAGFSGYVSREASLEVLVDGMQRALRGECACDPKIAGRLLREVGRRAAVAETESMDPLTRRENDVLGLVAQGLTNKEVARNLSISVATAKNHLQHIFRKLHVGSRAQVLARIRNSPWLVQKA